MDERPGTVLETAVIETPVLDAEPVAHAEPLTDDQLNQQISDTLPELFKHFHELGQRIATEFGMNGSDAIALLKLDAPMTMKELGQRMGCDPSSSPQSRMPWRSTDWPGGNPRCGTGGARTSCSPPRARPSGSGCSAKSWPRRRGAQRSTPASAGACSG